MTTISRERNVIVCMYTRKIHVRTQEEGSNQGLRRHQTCGRLHLKFLASRTVRNLICVSAPHLGKLMANSGKLIHPYTN